MARSGSGASLRSEAPSTCGRPTTSSLKSQRVWFFCTLRHQTERETMLDANPGESKGNGGIRRGKRHHAFRKSNGFGGPTSAFNPPFWQVVTLVLEGATQTMHLVRALLDQLVVLHAEVGPPKPLHPKRIHIPHLPLFLGVCASVMFPHAWVDVGGSLLSARTSRSVGSVAR